MPVNDLFMDETKLKAENQSLKQTKAKNLIIYWTQWNVEKKKQEKN